MKNVPGNRCQIKKMSRSPLPVRCMRVVCIGLVRSYQLFVSPLFPAACRYTPTCSQYAIDAIAEHGPVHGFFLAVGRILRCHPFAAGGYDPVRPKSSGTADDRSRD